MEGHSFHSCMLYNTVIRVKLTFFYNLKTLARSIFPDPRKINCNSKLVLS